MGVLLVVTLVLMRFTIGVLDCKCVVVCGFELGLIF